MIIVTIDQIPGKNYQVLGMVKGSTIQTVHFGKDLASTFKNLVGGELKDYNEMMENARDLATQRMSSEAEKLGADAIICTRFASASIMQSAAEVMVYGTAIKFV